MTDTNQPLSNETAQLRTLKEFLESAGPGTEELVTVDTDWKQNGSPASSSLSRTSYPSLIFKWPRIQLYCPHEDCDGVRFFSPVIGSDNQVAKFQRLFLTYHCKNCTGTQKIFALQLRAAEIKPDSPLSVLKFGEHPPLDEKVPNRLLNLVGKDRDLFFKGRRAERLGLGIGAYGYYRRVVENQKDQIFAKVAEAAKQLGHDELATEITAARSERKFTEAIERIKHALPETLKVGGHDPLRALHSALSEGLHNKDDQHCLEYAETIRDVLGGLAERIARAKQDEEKLKQSIGKLIREASGGGETINSPLEHERSRWSSRALRLGTSKNRLVIANH